MVSVFSSQEKKKFVAMLTAEQGAIFSEVHRTRLAIYVGGLVVGGIVGWIVYTGSGDKSLRCLCSAVGVAAVTAYFVYKLYPKDKWMLNYLNVEQTRAWLEMYKTMSFNFHFGFVVGLVGYAVLLKGMC